MILQIKTLFLLKNAPMLKKLWGNEGLKCLKVVLQKR